MSNRNKNAKLKIPYMSRMEFVLCAILGCVNLALLAVFCEFISVVSSVLITFIMLLIYLAEVAYIFYKHIQTQKSSEKKYIQALE